MDFSAANAALIEALGEPVEVTVDGVTTVMQMAFRPAYVGESLGKIAIERPDPELLAGAADWAALGAVNGDRLSVRGADYIVMDAQPDGNGGMRIQLASPPAAYEPVNIRITSADATRVTGGSA